MSESNQDLDVSLVGSDFEEAPEVEFQQEVAVVDNILDEEYPDVDLTIEMIKEGLGLLCKIGSGLQVAYTKLTLVNKALTNISILESYKHLRYIDLSNNNLSDITPISNCLQLLTLNCDNNKLPVIALGPLNFLQIASFANNNITSFLGICQMRLVELNLSQNWIARIMDLNPGMLENLRVLNLQSNLLKSMSGLALYHLTHLYLANNKITSLEGLDLLHGLEHLHLRGNQLQKLDLKTVDPLDIEVPGIDEQNPKLSYINLRSNKISKLYEVKKLNSILGLKHLVLKDNPLEKALAETYKIEILVVMPNLNQLDKMLYTKDERKEAKKLTEEKKALLERQLMEDLLAEQQEEEEEEEDDDEEEQEQQDDQDDLQNQDQQNP